MHIGNIIFSDPRFIETPPAWIEHIPFAFFLIETLKPNVFVELGTHYGNSYFAFCQAISELKLKSRTFAVDRWTGDEHSGYYGIEVFEYVDRINNQNFSHFSNLLKMSFDDANPYFNDGTIDLLHIDGTHNYEAVKHDFEMWLPKMSNKGIMILHDTKVYETGFGVWKLMEELKNRYHSMEFNHGNGLGIICTGNDVNTDFLHFIEKSNHDSFNANLFANLGEKLSLKLQTDFLLKELKRSREEQEQKNIELTKNIKEMNQIIMSRSWRLTMPLRYIMKIIDLISRRF